jgi:hypothetical protein
MPIFLQGRLLKHQAMKQIFILIATVFTVSMTACQSKQAPVPAASLSGEPTLEPVDAMHGAFNETLVKELQQ